MGKLVIRVESDSAALLQILAGVNELRSLVMSGKDDILREVQETQAQSATIVAALTALSNVVQPLMAAAAQSKTAMEAAQAALAASTADTLALEEQLAAAAVALDSSQTGVQAALDAVPPLPAVV